MAANPRPLSAERTVWPCGSSTVDLGVTNTRAFMENSDYRMAGGVQWRRHDRSLRFGSGRADGIAGAAQADAGWRFPLRGRHGARALRAQAGGRGGEVRV